MIALIEDKQLNLVKLLWYIITDYHFRKGIEQTLKYAVRHHDTKRGEGASDVMLLIKFKEDKFYNSWK